MKQTTDGHRAIQIHAAEHGGYVVVTVPTPAAPETKALVCGELGHCLDYIRRNMARHVEDGVQGEGIG